MEEESKAEENINIQESQAVIRINKKTLKYIALVPFFIFIIFAFSFSPVPASSIQSNSVQNLPSPSQAVTTDTNVQEITMTIDSSGWSPTQFVLKKGVPVKWKINGISLTGCNRMIIAPDFNIRYNVQQGENNLIEFTPNKVGTFSFTCSMGMMRGTFIVTETGTASQDQIKTAQAQQPKGGACGMSGGGGCGCGGM